MINAWYNGAVLPVQYGSDREKTRRGPNCPEGVLTDSQLAENRKDFLGLVRKHEFIDDDFYQQCGQDVDLSKINVPLLSVGNWVRTLINLFLVPC